MILAPKSARTIVLFGQNVEEVFNVSLANLFLLLQRLQYI